MLNLGQGLPNSRTVGMSHGLEAARPRVAGEETMPAWNGAPQRISELAGMSCRQLTGRFWVTCATLEL